MVLFGKSVGFSIEGHHYNGEERLIKAEILGVCLENIADSSVPKNCTKIICNS